MPRLHNDIPPTVEHNPEMNSLLLQTLAAHFSDIVMNLFISNGMEYVELVGIKGEEGKKYPPSCKHTIHMDADNNWSIINQEMDCVANYGDCLESLIICLKQFGYLWMSMDLSNDPTKASIPSEKAGNV